MRVSLRDDFGRQMPVPGSLPFSIPVILDEDRLGGSCGLAACQDTTPGVDVPDVPGLPTLTVRGRSTMLYNMDGQPEYTWRDLHSDVALTFEERIEMNDSTGQSVELVTATIGWPAGTRLARERDVVVGSDGRRWRITAVRPGPGRLGFDLERTDQDA